MDTFCKHCAKHKVPRKPKDPSRLNRTIDMIGECVLRGEFIETPNSKDPYYTEFESVQSKNYGDIIRCVFKCTECDNVFELNAMTYTGTDSNRFGIVK